MRTRLPGLAFLVVALALAPSTRAADPAKVLRISLPDITSLDPQQGSDFGVSGNSPDIDPASRTRAGIAKRVRLP